MPDELQQQTLLWIHLRRLAGRDTEEGRLEEIDAIDQPGRPGVALAWFATVWMIKKLSGPALRVDFRDRVLPGSEQSPESFQVLCPRKPAGCSDDRNRSVTHSARAYLRSVRARSALVAAPHKFHYTQEEPIARFAVMPVVAGERRKEAIEDSGLKACRCVLWLRSTRDRDKNMAHSASSDSLGRGLFHSRESGVKGS